MPKIRIELDAKNFLANHFLASEYLVYDWLCGDKN